MSTDHKGITALAFLCGLERVLDLPRGAMEVDIHSTDLAFDERSHSSRRYALYSTYVVEKYYKTRDPEEFFHYLH